MFLANLVVVFPQLGRSLDDVMNLTRDKKKVVGQCAPTFSCALFGMFASFFAFLCHAKTQKNANNDDAAFHANNDDAAFFNSVTFWCLLRDAMLYFLKMRLTCFVKIVSAFLQKCI